jgi:hypothetical protein
VLGFIVNLSFELENALHHVFHPIKAHILEINLLLKNIKNVIDRKKQSFTGYEHRTGRTGVGRRYRPRRVSRFPPSNPHAGPSVARHLFAAAIAFPEAAADDPDSTKWQPENSSEHLACATQDGSQPRGKRNTPRPPSIPLLGN